MNKENLRKKYLNMRNNISPKEIEYKSKIIISKLLKSSEYKKSQNIFTYLSFGSEVITHHFVEKALEDDKNIYIPYINSKKREMDVARLFSMKDLEPGTMGILEPKKEKLQIVTPNTVDLTITPGLVFNKSGYRIGYGGGYYDKFFNKLEVQPIKIGLCFHFQIVDDFPIDQYDESVDKIITEKDI